MLSVGPALSGIAEAHHLRPGTPAPILGLSGAWHQAYIQPTGAPKSLVLMRITDGTHAGLWARCSKAQKSAGRVAGALLWAVPHTLQSRLLHTPLPPLAGKSMQPFWFRGLIPWHFTASTVLEGLVVQGLQHFPDAGNEVSTETQGPLKNGWVSLKG